MKKLTIVLFSLLVLSACQPSKQQAESTNDQLPVFTVDEIEQEGDDFVGREIVVAGTVSHVCKHGGERCFLMGSREELTIRVEAGHQIGSFNQEQMGNDLKVRGVLQEIRIDDAYVAEMEAEMKDEGTVNNSDHAMGHDGNHEVDGGDHNQDQINQIAEMRQKIEASGKGYYSIFYLDGISCEEAE